MSKKGKPDIYVQYLVKNQTKLKDYLMQKHKIIPTTNSPHEYARLFVQALGLVVEKPGQKEIARVVASHCKQRKLLAGYFTGRQKHQRIIAGIAHHPSSKEFYASRAWINIRYEVLRERGARCECCGATAKDGVSIHVDHIKPRVAYPELALDKNNLQVLCEPCNIGKRHVHIDDWRAEIAARDVEPDNWIGDGLANSHPPLTDHVQHGQRCLFEFDA